VKSYIIRKSEIEAVLSETQDPEKIQAAVDMISENMSFGSDDIDLRYSADNESSDSSPYMHYYFALIAMTCLYGSWMSSNVLNSVMADQSEIGKRYECAPVSKFTTISASLFAGLIFLFMCVSALILFIQYVLGLSFNAPLGLIFLLSAAASMAGVSFGVMFGALFGRSQAALTAIPLIFSMGCSFLSGLMLGNMQQIIEVSAPWLNRINPAAVLADGLEELCTYGLGKGYFVDLFTLLAMSCVTIFISSLFLRRKSYASI
jgi:ABC-2 type transport system permease protein